MNQKTSKVEKEFYLRCSYLTLSVLFDKEPFSVAFRLYYSNQIWIGKPNANSEASMTISPRDG